MEDKNQYLSQLQLAWSGCRGCGLCEERTQTVFGFGNPNAQVMVIGEAPGENEDRHGVPFVGPAGAILHQFLGDVSARQEVVNAYCAVTAKKSTQASILEAKSELLEQLLQEFYFTNVVMCRPPENRDPIPKEIEACRTRLLEQIYTVDPVLIIAAGRVAAEAVIGKKVSITQSRGEIFDVEFSGRGVTYRYPVMPVLHPSYIMRRNDYLQKGGEAEKTRDDLLRAMIIVDEYNLLHYGISRPALRPQPLGAGRRR